VPVPGKGMLELVPVEKAIGLPLAHDITEIIPGKKKGPAFKKGHVICEADIEYLLRLGKRHIYVLKINADEVHEDDAAPILATVLAGEGVYWDEPPFEGKIELKAAWDGVLKVNVEALLKFNLIPDVMAATLHTNTPVKKGQKIAGTRIIPLVCKKEILEKVKKVGEKTGAVLKVLPYKYAKIGAVITGTEVYEGRNKDAFGEILRKKVQAYGAYLPKTLYAPDDAKKIKEAILALQAERVEVILTTGGMSVDPDDVTRLAISSLHPKELYYGSAVLPGAMGLVGYLKDKTPIIGIPACAIYYEITFLDLVLPRILAGEHITAHELAALGHGGYLYARH